MSEKLTLGLLFGGRSGEHEVSLMSARSVMSALDSERYDVVLIDIDHAGRWFAGDGALDAFESADLGGLDPVVLLPEPAGGWLFRRQADQTLERAVQLDVIFPMLHGTFGEDGTLQGLLELADMAYVGAGVLASAVAMDKVLFKSLMRAHNIPQIEFVALDSDVIISDVERTLNEAEGLGGYPLFTKPANLGSSVGVNKVGGRSDLVEGLMEAAQYDRRVIVERGIEAREIEVSVLGNESPEVSIAGEIVPGDEFYSYRAKYLDDNSELKIPAPIDDLMMEEVRSIAGRAFRAIDGAGMARVDFLLEKTTGRLYLNEINTIPGFTQISMYPKLWEASGLPFSELCDRLVVLGLARKAQRDRLVRTYGGDA
jgi:D-alanine-D-alanine ligase